MARLGRYFLPDQPLHVIQRGNNRDVVFFFRDADYESYRAWLAETAEEYGCAIHATCSRLSQLRLRCVSRVGNGPLALASTGTVV